MSAVIRGGDNLETKESPIGDKQSSPTVITPYDANNHIEPALRVMSLVANTAPTITSAESAVMTRPIAIFVGVDGSRLRRRIQPKKPTTTGVSATTQNVFIDW